MDVARFLGVWNWSQSRSTAKDLKVAASFSLSITDTPHERLRMQARQRAARNYGIKRGVPSATLRCGCADWSEVLPVRDAGLRGRLRSTRRYVRLPGMIF